jgi:hypothetical protein
MHPIRLFRGEWWDRRKDMGKMRTKVIPPLSEVRLIKVDASTPQWKNQIGRTFRVGYYSKQDGVDCIWLVNESGEYEQTVDAQQLEKFFQVVQISSEKAMFGRNRPPIPPRDSKPTPFMSTNAAPKVRRVAV